MADTTETPNACSRCRRTFEHLHVFQSRPSLQFCADCAAELLAAGGVAKFEKTIADELREAAARLRSSKIDPATIGGLPEVVRVGGVPLARCVKCDCVARVEGEAVYPLLIVALLNAREPLAAWLEKTAEDFDVEVEEHRPDCCGDVHEASGLLHTDGCGDWITVYRGHGGDPCACFDRAQAVARVLNGTEVPCV